MNNDTSAQSEEESFCQHWQKLLNAPQLLAPTGGWGNPMLQDGMPELAQDIFNMSATFKAMEHDTEEASPLKKGHEAVSAGTPQEMLDLLDLSPVGMDNESYTAMLFTDRSLIKPDADVVQIEKVTALRRIFSNVRCQRLEINPQNYFSQGERQSKILSRYEIALLIGLCAIATDDTTTIPRIATLLQSALKEDRLFDALFLATRLQELNAPKNAWFSTLLNCCITLNISDKAKELLSFWDELKATNPSGHIEVEICRAAYYTRGNNPSAALEHLESLPKVKELDATKALQRGLAFSALQQAEDALKSYNRCLFIDPKNIHALIARGIQTRTIHWESGDEVGLEKALKDFNQVIKDGGYHATEATFHAGTIYLAKNQMTDCEVMMRKVLQVEPNPVARRNLTLALHAQGRVEEAFAQYQHLCQYEPNNAKYLKRYFPN